MPLKPIILKGEQKRVLFLQTTETIQIKGVAGSGKTTVALYRAKHLLDTQSNLFQEAKVAIFTYNKTLVKYITAITPQISGGYQQDSDEIKPTKPLGLNVFVTSFHKWAYHFIEANGIPLSEYKLINGVQKRIFKTISGQIQNGIITSIKTKHSSQNIANKAVDFFIDEISWMKGKAFQSKEEYTEVKRTGRGTNDRVTKADKEIIWNIYTEYNLHLKANGQVDFDDYALLCLNIISLNPTFQKPFTHIIIDEAQDLSKAQILVISQIVSDETKSISIIADAAQRIYKSGFTWGEVGLNVRGGRTIEFKKNYRNTVQIVRAALSLLEKENDKSDFTTVETARKGEQKPIVGYFQNWNDQCSFLDRQLKELIQTNNINSTVILHRNHNGVRNIKIFLESKNYVVQELLKAEDIDFESDSLKICTLSSVKGLEFENVFIIDLNDDVIPYPAGFIYEDEEFQISIERRLLYTSMTRARERLYLLSSGLPSRFLCEIYSNYCENLEYREDNIKLLQWWYNLSKEWQSILQAHIEINEKSETFKRYFENGLAWIGDMKDGSENIFELYKREFKKDFTWIENYSLIPCVKKLRHLELYDLKLQNINPLSFFNNLISLRADNNNLKDIGSLTNLTELVQLDLSDNKISNISSLQNCFKLEHLDLSQNDISDVGFLKNLSSLSTLNLWNNSLKDITPLSNLMNLYSLYIAENNIENIAPISSLPKLGFLIISNNKITSISSIINSNITKIWIEGLSIMETEIDNFISKRSNYEIYFGEQRWLKSSNQKN